MLMNVRSFCIKLNTGIVIVIVLVSSAVLKNIIIAITIVTAIIIST